MFQISDKARDTLVVLSALLWVFLVIVSWIGNSALSLFGLITASFLMMTIFVLGTTVKNAMGISIPFLYPIVLSAVFWVAAFLLAYTTRGETETFILGFHPGQFWSLLFFWIGGFGTVMLSYSQYFDSHCLPKESWDSFMEEVQQIKAKKEN